MTASDATTSQLTTHDEQTIRRWLDGLGETDPATVALMIARARTSPRARRYLLEQAGVQEPMTRRQFHQLTAGELADLADSVAHALATELRRLDVAGAAESGRWALTDSIRRAILDHHRRAVERARSQ